ncbi:MAG TPA: hypothetical protein VF145_00880 [Chitinophagaceae bacterium]
MKFTLFIIASFFSIITTAQQNTFKLSAQKQILTIHLDEDNSNKKVTIDTKEKIANVQRLSIRGLAPELDKDWVRTFQIAASETAEAKVTMEADKESVYNYGLKELIAKLGTGTWKIYSLAVPKDAAKAAAVKSKRVLVATLAVI